MYMNTSPVTQPTTFPSLFVMKADSGSSKHFLKQTDAHIPTTQQHDLSTSVLLYQIKWN